MYRDCYFRVQFDTPGDHIPLLKRVFEERHVFVDLETQFEILSWGDLKPNTWVEVSIGNTYQDLAEDFQRAGLSGRYWLVDVENFDISPKDLDKFLSDEFIFEFGPQVNPRAKREAFRIAKKANEFEDFLAEFRKKCCTIQATFHSDNPSKEELQRFVEVICPNIRASDTFLQRVEQIIKEIKGE